MNYFKKLLFLTVALAIFACGEKKEEKEKITIGDNAPATTTNTATPEVTNEDEVVEIVISANDQMQFDTNEIKVAPGSLVKLTLMHTGEMNENVMGHNFVLLEKGTDINAFGQKAVAAAENDYIPENGEQVIAHTEIIGGGESTTIEFKAPEAGTYDFICSFPGHYALMRGKFIVQ